jgi:hypothetical protein
MSRLQKSQRYEYRRRFLLQVGQVLCGLESSIMKEYLAYVAQWGRQLRISPFFVSPFLLILTI